MGEVERRRELDEWRLAYLGEAPVNWCPALGTVLANEEVTADGRSERGNHPVFRRPMKQWMMRITAYADRLLEDLDTLDWTDSIKTMQRVDRALQRRSQLRLPAENPSKCSPPDRTPFWHHSHGACPRAPVSGLLVADDWPDGTPWRGQVMLRLHAKRWMRIADQPQSCQI